MKDIDDTLFFKTPWIERSLWTIVCLLISSSALAEIRLVPNDYQTIQSAIEAAGNGDTVLVDRGIYFENISFLEKEITVTSRYLIDNDRSLIDSTIIDGGRDSNAVRIESCPEGTELKGFTIQHGHYQYGGGIYVWDASVSLSDLILRNNIVPERFDEVGGGGAGIYCTAGSFANLRRIKVLSCWSFSYGGGIGIKSSTAILDSVEVRSCTSGHSGAGLHFFQAEVLVRNCLIVGNQTQLGSAATISESTVIFEHTLINENASTYEGNNASTFYIKSSDVTFDHVTMMNNDESIGAEGADICLQHHNEEDSNSTMQIRNSILWGESFAILSDERGEIRVDYSCVDPNPELHDLIEDTLLVWGEGNLYTMPQLDESFRITDFRSNCIDIGDPESPLDPDSTRADLGAFFFRQFSLARGLVQAFEDDRVLPGVHLTAWSDGHLLDEGQSDDEGGWQLHLPDVLPELTIHASTAGYLTDQRAWGRIDLDTLRVDFTLMQLGRMVDPAEIRATLAPDDSVTYIVQIWNPGDSAVTVFVTPVNFGFPGTETWAVREELELGAMLQSEYLGGLQYVGENFYAGISDGAGENQIMKLTRDGELISAIPQPGDYNYGAFDFAWDGELLWYGSSREIFAFSEAGELMQRFDGPWISNSAIAWDSNQNCLWIASTTSNIVAYDSDGNALDRFIRTGGLRIYGLDYSPEAYLDNTLLALTRDQEQSSIYAFDTENDSVYKITDLVPGEIYKGLSTSYSYDGYGGWTLFTARNRELEDGGDLMTIYQLTQNTSWVTVSSSEVIIAPGEVSEFSVSLNSLGLGVFDTRLGRLIFAGVERLNDFSIPLSIHVVPDVIEPASSLTAYSFQLYEPFPNPFNSSVTISYSVRQASLPVQLAIYDISGRLVADLTEQSQIQNLKSKIGKVVWDASSIGAGVYFVRLEAGEKIATQKIVLTR